MSVFVGRATSAICVFVRVICHVIHSLWVGWMVEIRYYLLILVGESYIRKSRSIVCISHFHHLCFHLQVNFSLNPSVKVTPQMLWSTMIKAIFCKHHLSLRDQWIVNSTCSYHMCFIGEFFTTYVSTQDSVLIKNDHSCKIEVIWSIWIQMFDAKVLTLTNVSHIFNMRKNLISLGRLT